MWILNANDSERFNISNKKVQSQEFSFLPEISNEAKNQIESE